VEASDGEVMGVLDTIRGNNLAAGAGFGLSRRAKVHLPRDYAGGCTGKTSSDVS
jgi:hypothetical protein